MCRLFRHRQSRKIVPRTLTLDVNVIKLQRKVSHQSIVFGSDAYNSVMKVRQEVSISSGEELTGSIGSILGFLEEQSNLYTK